MEQITYKNIINKVVENFPEYKASEEFEKDSVDSQYAILAGFGKFLTRKIEEQAESQELIKRAFQFVNDIYNGPVVKNDSDPPDTLQNLFYIEIFENLAQTKKGVEAARKYLEGSAKDEFETVFKHTGVEEYDPNEKNESIMAKWQKPDN
jgi:hypothetical protein